MRLSAIIMVLALLSPIVALGQDAEPPKEEPAPPEKKEEPTPEKPDSEEPADPPEKPDEEPLDPDEPADPPEEEEPEPAEKHESAEAYKEIEMLAKAIELIRQNYVDESKINYRDLMTAALEGMLRSLDPHCQFVRQKTYETLKPSQTKTYQGVGITVSYKEDVLNIISVHETGPAALAGILSGDQILQIGDVLTDKISHIETLQTHLLIEPAA